MQGLWRDLAFGARKLRKTPAVTVAVIVTLALAIAANSVAFSLVNSFFIRPLPVRDAHKLVRIYSSYASGRQYFTVSYPDYADFGELSAVFSGVAASMPVAVSVGKPGETERVWGSRVSGNYFSVLGVAPALGRFFAAEEAAKGGGAAVVVLSYGLSQRRFGASRGIIGETIALNGRPSTVIGVAPESFHGVDLGLAPELWLPVTTNVHDRGARGCFVVGRLQPGADISQARAALDVLARRLQETYPLTNQGIRFTAIPESEGRVHPVARGNVLGVSGVLMGVAVLVLVVACANVAGILLARAASRRREIGARLAMGATRRRIIRRLLTLLHGVEGADPLVFGLAPVALVTVCVVASWAPAWRAVRIDAATALRHE